MEQQIIYTLAAILTIAIFSFLWRDNPLYKFAEHLVVGISAGYFVVILYKTSLVDLLVTPMGKVLKGSSSLFSLEGLVIVPGILGLLLFTRFTQRFSWVSRIPIAYILGVGSGAAIPLSLQTNVIQQIYPTMTMFGQGSQANANAWITAILVLVAVVCGLAYFYFSARHDGALGWLSKIGIWLLMVGFGASFGYTVMSRISLLYGRVSFLVFDWARPIVHSILHTG